MTIQEKKQLVREAIIKAVPSVMDLKMGCRIKSKDWNSKNEIKTICGKSWNDERSVYKWMVIDEREIVFSLPKEYEIIGRPITLADVLVAIGKKMQFNASWEPLREAQGKLLLPYYNQGKYQNDRLWNPLEDFDHQSEELYNFLYELIYEKTIT